MNPNIREIDILCNVLRTRNLPAILKITDVSRDVTKVVSFGSV